MEGQERCECPPPYLRTIPGMLKIVELVLTILTFSISFGSIWSYRGGAWVESCGISCFLTIAIWLVLHMIKPPARFYLSYLYELIVYCIMTIILLISGIVAAARAGQYNNTTIGACSFFAFASAIVCGVDFYRQYLAYQKGNYQASSGATTVETTTTSHTTVIATY